METLHEEEKAETKAKAATKLRLPSPHRFSPLELSAAEQLIHLSESSSSAAFTPTGAPPSAASAASASSSPRSVNAPPPPLVPLHDTADDDEDDDDDDEQEVSGRQRRNKRYRSIAEIYAATAPIGSGSSQKNKKGMEERKK